jgi:2-polyprenyl-3-methyl-5-hydroxy-6-metoxy-1,4-benzoquinol methylase
MQRNRCQELPRCHKWTCAVVLLVLGPEVVIKPHPPCPVCSATRSNFLGDFACRAEDRQFKYYRCLTCNHLFLYPQPGFDLLTNYYEHKFAQGNYRDYGIFEGGKQIAFDAIIKEIISHLDSQDRILEFGCGEGLFLRRLAHFGFKNLCGMDVSKVAISQAQKSLPDNYEGRLYCGTEHDLLRLFQPRSINTLVGLDVIEHVCSPLSFLGDAFQVLTPDGVLILTTPCLDSLASKLLGTRWQYFLPLEHIHLFSTNSIKAALSKTGFAELVVRKQKRYFDLNYSASCLEAIYRFQGKTWSTFKSLVHTVSKVMPGVSINVGLMTVLATKRAGRLKTFMAPQ